MDIMVKQMHWLVTLLLVISVATAQSKSSKEAYCEINPKHTMCLYDEGPAEKCKTPFARGFNKTEKNAIVNEHNRLRNIVALGKESRGNPGPQPNAANMRKISWNDELATVAQRWADQCKDGHDANRNTLDRTYVGQSIHYTHKGPSRSGKCLVVASFYNEVKEFNKSHVDRYVTGSAGHYTQVVWANTHQVGCGYISYPGKSSHSATVVCNYKPGGNILSTAMYKVGKPCSDCPKGTKCDTKYKGLCV